MGGSSPELPATSPEAADPARPVRHSERTLLGRPAWWLLRRIGRVHDRDPAPQKYAQEMDLNATASWIQENSGAWGARVQDPRSVKIATNSALAHDQALPGEQRMLT